MFVAEYGIKTAFQLFKSNNFGKKYPIKYSCIYKSEQKICVDLTKLKTELLSTIYPVTETANQCIQT